MIPIGQQFTATYSGTVEGPFRCEVSELAARQRELACGVQDRSTTRPRSESQIPSAALQRTRASRTLVVVDGAMKSLLTFVLLATPLAACKRPPESVPSAASAPIVSTHSPEPPPVSESDPVPFLASGCPEGQHDVRKWKRVDPASITEQQLSSLNYSRCEWKVSVRDGAPLAEADRDAKPAVAARFQLPNQWGPPRVVRQGKAGTLFGFNHGEWGGALLWYSDDGAFKAKLIDENVVELLATTEGFIVFTGLNHLGSDVGRATELVDTGSVFRTGRSVDLGSAPRAVASESDGTVLVITTAGVVRLSRAFQVEPILKTRCGSLYPVSVALDGATAYVGMRGVVAEVQLRAGAASETWLSPVERAPCDTDQSCNDNPAVSALWGRCVGSVCQCRPGFALTASGRCKPAPDAGRGSGER